MALYVHNIGMLIDQWLEDVYPRHNTCIKAGIPQKYGIYIHRKVLPVAPATRYGNNLRNIKTTST
jgi:hypothetical protein